MQIFGSLGELSRDRPTIMTIGAFDGVHRGHQFLISQVIKRARATACQSLVLTFDPRPVVILRPGSAQLSDRTEKIRVIESVGPDVVAAVPFNKALSQQPAGEFLHDLLEHVDVREIWIGADFAFGHNREGTVEFLIREGEVQGYDVHVLARRRLGNTPISSTRIREQVRTGEVDLAAELLGHRFRFDGVVGSGFGRGRELGFPTANVQPPPFQLVPGPGIYACHIWVDGAAYPSALSVGFNPVFDGKEITVEAYILDFDADVRGETVGVEFVARIRDEQKFDGIDALVAEMQRDVLAARRLLATG